MPQLNKPQANAARAQSIDELQVTGKTFLVFHQEYVEEVKEGLDLVRATVIDSEGVYWEWPLFVPQNLTPNTKLGAFCEALGYDTDTWPGKTFHVDIWSSKDKRLTALDLTQPKETPKDGKTRRR